MSIKEDIEELKIKAEELEKESFAMELLKDSKKQNIRLFWIWIITFLALISTVIYTIHLLNDISVIETTENNQEVTDFETVEGNIINAGDKYGENKTK